jgi:hypothetical protein
VIASKEVLKAFYLGQKEIQIGSDLEKYLTPTWRERLESYNNKTPETATESFGKNESLLIDLLASGPQHKLQLIHKLYGDKISFESGENRLRVTISRIKKKIPGLIVLFNDHYELCDGSRLSLHKSRKPA